MGVDVGDAASGAAVVNDADGGAAVNDADGGADVDAAGRLPIGVGLVAGAMSPAERL
jgi:hypothetical protein